MIISEVHYDIAYHKIMSCRDTTAYTSEDIANMFECSMFVLNTLNEINTKTVIAKNYKDEDIEIVIHIEDIKFHHNMMMVYVKGYVRDYIKDYVSDAVKTWNERYNVSDKTARWRSLRNSSDGYGHAIVYCYDAYDKKLN